MIFFPSISPALLFHHFVTVSFSVCRRLQLTLIFSFKVQNFRRYDVSYVMTYRPPKPVQITACVHTYMA